jgi:ligand-binding SRPBCC domain-containing protein
MPVFHSQFKVQATIDQVFAFHRDARNLGKVQPPYPRLLSLRCPDILNIDDTVEIELGPFPRQSWKALVEELRPPRGNPLQALMIDSALKSPFHFFRHRHFFQADGTSTFDPPWGKFGWLLLPAIYLILNLIFIYRRIQTRRLLSS